MMTVKRIVVLLAEAAATALAVEVILLENRDRRVRRSTRRSECTRGPSAAQPNWGLTWMDPDDDDVDLEFRPCTLTSHFAVDANGVLHRNPLSPEDRDFWLPNGQDGGWGRDGYWHTSRDDAIGF